MSAYGPSWYGRGMPDLEDLERAVEKLSPAEYDAFRDWFERFEALRFDRAIAHDAETGRLNQLAEEALAEFDLTRTRRL